MNYVLGVDCYEGNPDIDEPTLKANGVEFMVVRLNDMQGGSHMDQNFTAQWAQAGSFIHWPYMVYNPWVNGKANYDWLIANLPAEVRTVAIDIEVKYPGYPPLTYAQEVDGFTNRCLVHGLNVINYSGEWFLEYLAHWPMQVPYWWARYPYTLYPSTSQYLTWEQLKAKIEAVGWAAGISLPVSCKLWQCTADRYYLPGCSTKLDINIFNGTKDELISMVSGSPIPPTLPRFVSTTGVVNVHSTPEIVSGNIVGVVNSTGLPVAEDAGDCWKIGSFYLAKSVTKPKA